MWIDHDGKSPPKYAGFHDLVHVRFRDGVETSGTPEFVSRFCGVGNNWKWGVPADTDNEIVAYKVIRDE